MDKLDIPPVWLLALSAVAFGISRLWPWPGICTWMIVSGVALVLLGLALTIWAVRTMGKAKTTIIPRRNPSGLVTEGPFRFSRNPIYLSDAMILAGLCLIFGSIPALVTVPVFVIMIQNRFILDEESRLSRGFADEFALWKDRTRRWI